MDQQVKERVVGAAVLVCAAVVFVPMILSGPDGGPPAAAPEKPAAPAPATPGRGFSSRIVPLGESAAAGSEPAPPSPSPSPVPVPDVPREPPAPPAAAPVTEPAAAPAPRPDAPVVTRGGWVVQLGSFSNPRNAHALRDRLKARGWSSFAVTSGPGSDAVTRVYVGPEEDRERAEAQLATLFRETRLKGIVVRNPGG